MKNALTAHTTLSYQVLVDILKLLLKWKEMNFTYAFHHSICLEKRLLFMKQQQRLKGINAYRKERTL